MHSYPLKKLILPLISLCCSMASMAQPATRPATRTKSVGSQLQAEGEKLQLEAQKLQLEGQKLETEAGNLNALTVAGFKKVDPKDLKTKEISAEFPAAKTADIFIENNSRNISIKVWDQPKVKVVTTVQYDGDATKITDAEWFEKINISFRNTASSIRIKTGSNGNNFYRVEGNNLSWGGAQIAYASGEGISTNSRSKKSLTIYIPKENNIDIESKYAEVLVEGNLNKLNADIANGGLEMDEANKLFLRSKYSNVSTGNLKTAEVELINGRFISKDIEDLDIDTKYATVEAGAVKKMMLRSTNDEYEIEELGAMTGRKNYGNLRITKLLSSFDLDGTNADIKIRNIGSGLESIKINNKYADIRLPMRNVKNYEVAYQGAFSTVYAAFEKIPVKDKEEEKTAETNKKINSQFQSINRSVGTYAFAEREISPDGHFTAKVGDGKGAKLNLNCQNCTVDFK